MPKTVITSWDEVAAACGVARCRGRLPTGLTCYEEHDRGHVSGGVVHWNDRRVTKAGIRAFIILSLECRGWGTQWLSQPVWYRLWRTNITVYDIALSRLHIRLPASLADVDRARCKALLIDVPTSAPDRATAMRWANGGWYR